MQIPASTKVVFDNGSKYKRDYTPLLNDFDIKPVLMTIKNTQANTLLEWVHQVILNMLVTKYLDNNIFDIYIHGVKP